MGMSLRVLLVDDNPDRAAAVRQALEAHGCVVAAVVPDASALVEAVRRSAAEVIVCGLDSPSRDTLESLRALHRDEPRPVARCVDRSDPDSMVAAVEAGVAAYVVEGLAPARVKSVLDVAMAQFRAHQALRSELQAARGALEAREMTDRAKRLLMQTRGMSEDAAHRALRKMAMDRGKRLADIAADVIAMADILNNKSP